MESNKGRQWYLNFVPFHYRRNFLHPLKLDKQAQRVVMEKPLAKLKDMDIKFIFRSRIFCSFWMFSELEPVNPVHVHLNNTRDPRRRCPQLNYNYMAKENLRNRLKPTAEALGIGQSNVESKVTSEKLLSFEDHFKPIFSSSFYDQLRSSDPDESHRKVAGLTAVLENTLRVPLYSVTTLNVKPGETHFVAWLIVSSYFPLIVACIAPLGNLMSLICLIEHWRIRKTDLRFVREPEHIFALNLVSFCLGVLGNVSLLLNFSRTVKYLVTQCLSIACWVAAASTLLVAILVLNADFVGDNVEYSRSEGFWLAVFTIFFYDLCAIILMINFVGYRLNKYPAEFNLNKKQRLLMLYTIAFSIWQIVGLVTMSHLIPGLNYGASLYYCTVSMLTIGLGDIVPNSTGARVWALIFSFIGLIIMGLIVTMITQVVLVTAGPSIFWHIVELERIKLAESLDSKGIVLTPEKAFHSMRLLRWKARMFQLKVSCALSVLIFFVFWLIGGLVFHYTEGWKYFELIYFCFLCLLTIGYGDFHPESALGRAFFIQWAIAAVPIMTVLISNVGDFVLELGEKINFYVAVILSWRTYSLLFSSRKNSFAEQVLETRKQFLESEEDFEAELLKSSRESDIISKHDIQNVFINHRRATQRIRHKLALVKRILRDVIENPDKLYNHDEWSEICRNLAAEPGLEGEIDTEFWLGEKSPLRLPLKEPNYAIIKIIFLLDLEIQELIDEQDEELRSVAEAKSMASLT